MRNTREQTTNEVERKKKEGRENTASTRHFKPTANYLIFGGKKDLLSASYQSENMLRTSPEQTLSSKVNAEVGAVLAVQTRRGTQANHPPLS